MEKASWSDAPPTIKILGETITTRSFRQAGISISPNPRIWFASFATAPSGTTLGFLSLCGSWSAPSANYNMTAWRWRSVPPSGCIRICTSGKHTLPTSPVQRRGSISRSVSIGSGICAGKGKSGHERTIQGAVLPHRQTPAR